MRKIKQLAPSDFLRALVRTGYLPQELPPVITTRNFAEFCKTEYAFLKSQKANLLKSNTQQATFSAPRQNFSRRHLSVVHPRGQLAISLAITEHRAAIKKLISKSGTSLYRTSHDPKRQRAFQGLNFRKWSRELAKMQSEYPFVLTADITRFFYTIYTHSIPWAALGKDKAKNWHFTNKAKLNAHWSNDLDKAAQSCQSRETFGIPVGPDTSRIIAEIVMAGIEADKGFSAWLTERSAIRLVDDFAIGFELEADAQKALAALRTTLWKFNLQLNDEKTKIVPSRMSLTDKWELEQGAILISGSNARQQAAAITRLLDFTLHLCHEAKSDNPAIRACQRIGRLKMVDANFMLILDTLFRLAREFPRCVSHVSTFLMNNRILCQGALYKPRIEKWVRSMLRAHTVHGHDFEVAWCLLVCGALQIQVKKSNVTTDNRLPNSIIFALLGLLRERKLFVEPLSSWPWRAEFRKTGINSHNWLPYYEAVHRKWTTDKKLIAALKTDPILTKMLSNKVTFLEDRVFEAKKIDLISRTFKPEQLSKKKGPKVKGFGDLKISPADLGYDT